MNDRSSFDRAYEEFHSVSDIAPPKGQAGKLSARAETLRNLLFDHGLAPKVDDDGDLTATFRGWTFWLSAPDEDSDWTAITCTIGPFDSTLFERLDETISGINAELKCVQAFRAGEVVQVTLGLLTDTEPSVRLLRRSFNIMLSAVERLSASA